MLWKGDQSPRVKKKAHVERKVGECFQWQAHDHLIPEETHAVSVMTQRSLSKGQKRQGRSSSPASHSKAKQTDGEEQKSSQISGSKQESSLNKSEIPCRFKFSKNPSCKFWHPPVCLNCKSEQRCVHGDKCHFRHVEAERKPNKRSNKGGPKGSVAMSKESGQLGCVSEDFFREKCVLRERERKVPSRGIILKWSPHERCPCRERSHEETLHQERCARKAAWDLARNIYKLKIQTKLRSLYSN